MARVGARTGMSGVGPAPDRERPQRRPAAGAVEIELKFRLPENAAEEVLQHPLLQGRKRSARMRSIYFDTPDRDLRRCGLGLRVRNTGHGFVQTVKQDDGSGGITRGEWEAPTEEESLNPGALADTPAAKVLDGRIGALQPVFSTTVERRTRLSRENGGVIEIAFDVGEVSTGDRREAISEVELELKEGDPRILFDFGRRLVRETPLRLSFQGKAERGHRLVDGATLEPRSGESPTLSPDLDAGQAFQAIALSCLAQVVGNAEVLERALRPEAVHQTRVGLRRLRAALAAFQPMLRDDEHDGVEAELKWLARELDPARDMDVFIEDVFRPAARETGDDSLAVLGRRLLEAQTRAYDRVLQAVTSRRCAVLVMDAAAWIEAGAWTRSTDAVLASLRAHPAAGFASDALDRLCKVVRRRGRRFGQLDSAGRHKLRIRAKRLRYAVEFFDPLFPDASKSRHKFLQALKDLQDCLGALNDLSVARAQIPVWPGLDQSDVAFAAGRIIGRREAQEATLLTEAAAAFEAFDDSPPFWRRP